MIDEIHDEAERIGHLSIEVLTFLKGQPWDDIARAYVYALRPSSVRISGASGLTCDARAWRVTVTLDSEQRIDEITQEVKVALPAGIAHGHDLSCELAKRRK